MIKSRSQTQTTVDVSVRNLAGKNWKEQWTLEKLAYFILMADLDQPKFEQSLRAEWVPFDTNLYSWNKGALTYSEFDSIVARWPRSEQRSFDRTVCDSVQLSYRLGKSRTGVGFHPTAEPALYDALVRAAEGKLRYIEFDYSRARDVYELLIDEELRIQLRDSGAAVRDALGRLNGHLLNALDAGDLSDGKVLFLCRRGSFEVPITIWYEI